MEELTQKKAEDRRVRKTRALLRETLLSLLMEKDIKEITVKELVEAADINRGTFYLHCRDIYDLFRQIEDESMKDLIGILSHFDTATLEAKLVRTFQYLKDNRRLCELMLLKNGDLAFLDKVKHSLETVCFPGIQATYKADNPHRYSLFMAYTLSGCVGLLQVWLKNDLRESPEEMAQITSQLVNNGVEFLGKPV